MKESRNRTYSLGIKEPALSAALKACCRQAKNINNGTLFLVKNVFSSYEDNQLKPCLHENQVRAIATVNDDIAYTNATREGKPKQNEPTPSPSDVGNPFSILDMTIIRTLATKLGSFDENSPFKHSFRAEILSVPIPA